MLPKIEALATGTTELTIHREGVKGPVQVDLTRVFGAASDRHVEIMRDDLSEAYYGAGRDDVEYLFGDSITAISPDGEVTFEHAAPRRFDAVVGSDGLHSNVRNLVSVRTPHEPGSSVGTWRCCPPRKSLHAKESPSFTSAPAESR